MREELRFRFDGLLATNHQMNFYEAARFQYAASRLMVKLAKFRGNGRVSSKVTASNNVDIRIKSLMDGSFNINIEDFSKKSEDVDLSLSDALSFLGDRVIPKSDDDYVNLSSVTDLGELKFKDILKTSGLDDEQISRVISDGARREKLENKKQIFKSISENYGQNLVSAAAPLMKDMSTALRTSASKLEIFTSDNDFERPIIYFDKQISDSIELSSIDDKMVEISCNVVQFNKENGFGKIRFFTSGNNQDKSTVGMHVPYNKIDDVRARLIIGMRETEVVLKGYLVRNLSNEVVRMIVVGVGEDFAG